MISVNIKWQMDSDGIRSQAGAAEQFVRRELLLLSGKSHRSTFSVNRVDRKAIEMRAAEPEE